MVRTAWAFVKRDFLIDTSYRTAFLGQLAYIFGGVSLFYYVGRVFDGAMSPALASYGGNYFAFALIGVALTDFLKVSLSTFNVSIRESQMMGTLEMMFLSPVGVTSILIYSSIWSYVVASVRFLAYLLTGVLLYGFDLQNANLFGGLVVLFVSVLCFSAFGILTAAFTVVFKKGDISSLMSIASVFLGGVLFPPEVLPGWLKQASFLLPITHSVSGLRKALIGGETLTGLLPEITTLLLFSLVLFSIGITSFVMAVHRTKVTGTLGQY
jgi:ABC-2 type transport system permease protein